MSDAFLFVKRMAALGNLSFGAVPNSFLVIKGLLLIAFLAVVELTSFRFAFGEALKRSPAFQVASGLVLLYGIALLGTFQGATFIYFQF
jgi:hypothetical protein